MIEIVTYSASLQQPVVDLILKIQREEFAFDIAAHDQPDLLDISNFYQTGSGNFWVALSAGEPIGTVALRDIGNHQGALRKMFVKATHRGREQGVAARLLAQLIESAKAHRVQEVFLGTTEKFLAAHRFYEKNGFTQVPPETLPSAFPRMSLDTRFYRRVHGSKST
jgi:N-acetylglutamate synthase-like GNAT family acetyltransferase